MGNDFELSPESRESLETVVICCRLAVESPSEERLETARIACVRAHASLHMPCDGAAASALREGDRHA